MNDPVSAGTRLLPVPASASVALAGRPARASAGPRRPRRTKFAGLGAILLASTGVCLPVLARAQDSAAVPTDAPAASTQAGEQAGDDVVVTGSRVVTNGNSSPTPVTVVRAADLLTAQPTSLFDGLASLPVFAGSRGQLAQPTGGPAGGGNGAVSALNLRNLGPTRTLVLVNGQRVPPATYNGLVDTDIIPEAFIQRVDTVTGGVSAVYGSDAVSGVVNFVTDNKFVGLKAGVQAGISDYGDGEQHKFYIAAGTDLFGGRGHIEASFNHFHDDGIASRLSRPYNLSAYTGSGTAASPYVLTPNARLSGFTFGGLITSGPLSRQTFNSDGVLTPFVNGTATGTATTQIGGDGAYQDAGLKAPQTADQFFVRFDYDLGDAVQFHVQGMGNIKSDVQYFNYNTLSNVTINSGNAFLSPAIRSALAGTTTFTFSKVFNQMALYDIDSHQDEYFINTGLSGKIGGDADWGIDFNYGNTALHNSYHNNINNQKLSAALDAVNVGGTVQCYAATQAATAAAYANCVPINVFGPTAASDAAIDYVTDTTHLSVKNITYDVLAHVGASPFSTWAGPVRVALSAEWRRNSLSFVSDTLPTDLVNCTSLRYNCGATQSVNVSNQANMPKRSQTVKEGAIEVLVPLLKDSAVARALDFTGAARYTSYSTTGDYWTWKLGLNWQVTDGLSVRATQSRDIRAPTLYDLYQPLFYTLNTVNDLLIKGAPYTSPTTFFNVPVYNYGNPDLKAERGTTRTVGVVWRPSSVPNFSVAVDYYSIKVKDAFQQIRGFDVGVQQACYLSGGSSPYCGLQVRKLGNLSVDPANTPVAFNATQLNLASIRTSGVDVEANYRASLGGHGVALRLFTTYQPHIYVALPGTVTLDQGGAANGNPPFFSSARWRVNGFVSVDVTQAVNLDVRERWRSSMRYDGIPTDVFAQRLGAVAYTDLNLTVKVDDDRAKPEFYINVQNLFNKAPPAFATGTVPGQSYALSDDPVGRYFTVGARVRF